MKQANNNEIDLMLRSLARRADAPQTQPGSNHDRAASSEHLDADELNSYAEGMVPAPARARYSEHLADCDACRGIVVSLSQSAGVARDFVVTEPPVESSFWQKVTAVFSPAVLRFAVPALLLTVVIGVGLWAFRQQQQNEFVARNESPNLPAAASVPDESQLKAQNSASPLALPDASASPAISLREKEKAAPKDADTRLAEAPPESAGLTAAAPPVMKDSARASEGTDDLATARPDVSEPTAAPPSARPGVIAGEVDRAAELAKAPAKREDQPRSRDEFKQREEEHGPNRSRSNTAQTTGGRGALMSNRGPSNTTQNKVYVETRSVAGRYFTREGNAWVDTEYNSSRSVTGVTRGSEHYRSLVADEPGLRTVAEQLSGVVIVVWKNRAYRIQ